MCLPVTVALDGSFTWTAEPHAAHDTAKTHHHVRPYMTTWFYKILLLLFIIVVVIIIIGK